MRVFELEVENAEDNDGGNDLAVSRFESILAKVRKVDENALKILYKWREWREQKVDNFKKLIKWRDPMFGK